MKGAAISVAARTSGPQRGGRRVTTLSFAGVSDHVRMPARFFGRFTACAEARVGA